MTSIVSITVAILFISLPFSTAIGAAPPNPENADEFPPIADLSLSAKPFRAKYCFGNPDQDRYHFDLLCISVNNNTGLKTQKMACPQAELRPRIISKYFDDAPALLDHEVEGSANRNYHFHRNAMDLDSDPLQRIDISIIQPQLDQLAASAKLIGLATNTKNNWDSAELKRLQHSTAGGVDIIAQLTAIGSTVRDLLGKRTFEQLCDVYHREAKKAVDRARMKGLIFDESYDEQTLIMKKAADDFPPLTSSTMRLEDYAVRCFYSTDKEGLGIIIDREGQPEIDEIRCRKGRYLDGFVATWYNSSLTTYSSGQVEHFFKSVPESSNVDPLKAFDASSMLEVRYQLSRKMNDMTMLVPENASARSKFVSPRDLHTNERFLEADAVRLQERLCEGMMYGISEFFTFKNLCADVNRSATELLRLARK